MGDVAIGAGPLISARLYFLLLVLAGAAFVFDLWRYADHVIDDTFISLRYARNWVDGHGLVFNPGERVEGYTNFLFVAAAAGWLRLGADPVLGTKALSIAMSIATLVAVAKLETLAPQLTPRSLPAALLLVLALEAYVYWSAASFETMPFTGFLTVALYLLLREGDTRRGHASAVLFVLLALTRPEGVYLFVLCTGVAFGIETWCRPGTGQLRRHAINTVIFAACFAPYFVWRSSYYGGFFPNTFYAKVAGGGSLFASGLHYLGEFALAFPALTLALFLPLAVLRGGRRALQDSVVPFAVVYLVILGYVVYVVGVGGDFMPFFRFFVPILPMCCVLLVWTLAVLARASSSWTRIVRWALPGAVIVSLFASHATEQPYRAFVAFRTATVGAQVGAWLATQVGLDDLIAVNTAGAVPYFSRLPTIDMLGLTDAQIAARPVYITSTGWAGHRRGWGDYVLSRRPRVVLWYNSAGSRQPFYLSDHELADNPFFRFFYRSKAATLPAEAGDGNTGRVLERFLGDPFEVGGLERAFSADLGLEADLHDALFRYTALRDSPITVNYFELDDRDAVLWPLARRGDLDQLLDAAVERWAALPPPPAPDAKLAARVEALCGEAHRQVEVGDFTAARRTLSAAVRENAHVHSALVYQYVANLAVMTDDPLVAVDAQKEALRLAPRNALYRANLKSLLTTAFAQRRKVPPRDRTSLPHGNL